MFEPPSVLPAQGLLDKAFRRASKATSSKGRTRVERTRNLAIAKVQAVSDVLTTTLEGYVKGFPSLDRLPPFYRELLDATLGLRALHTHLAAVDWAARKVRDLARQYPRRIQKATPGEVAGIRREAFGRLSSVVDQVGSHLEALGKARSVLRKMPDIDPDSPTIVVAGFPNVGKSQFVAAVSSGKPRIAPYPFTTKGVSVGHFEVRYRRFQVLDTPGLLDRPMEDRNPMERQAVSALAHLAHAVVFVLDPTETCGYPLDGQLRLLETVRSTFPGVAVLVVENKVDLLRTGSDRPKMSALTGEGTKEVLAEAVRLATLRAPGAALPGGSG